MSLKAKIEAIVYAAEEPVTVDQILAVVADEISSETARAEQLTTDGVETQPDAATPETETLSDAKDQAKQQRDQGRRRIREVMEQLMADYDSPEHGMEIRQVA